MHEEHYPRTPGIMGTGRQHSRDPGMQREFEEEGEEVSEKGSVRVMECVREGVKE